MDIKEVREGKKQYLDLLLLADEQENMIDRYLTKGTMYVLEDDGVKAECVVLDVGGGVLEIKNIATAPQFHGNGYGKALIEFIVNNIGAIIRYCRSERVTAHQRSLFMKNAALPVLILSRTSLLIIMTTRSMTAV